MGRRRCPNSILRCGFSLNFSLSNFFFWSALFVGHFNPYSSYADSSSTTSPFNSFTISSVTYPETRVEPFEWRYIRVNVPPWFSSMSVELESDVDIEPRHISKMSKNALPLICLREGSLPLPDFSSSFHNLVLQPSLNESMKEAQGIQNGEHCYPLQKSLILQLTSKQIIPGAWYFGLFNGIGAMRTQSSMINRGRAYIFSATVSVEVCTSPNLWGPYCNQTVEFLSCAQSFTNGYSSKVSSLANLYNQTTNFVISCQSLLEDSCLLDNERRVYSMEITGLVEQLVILAADVSLNYMSNVGGVVLICYARYGAMPSATMYDYAGNIDILPLIIQSPKIGLWYFNIVLANATTTFGQTQKVSGRICYSLGWLVVECPKGKAGFNCSWEQHMLQMVLRKNPSAPLESYYIPPRGKISSDSVKFPLQPLLSNNSSSLGSPLGYAWTYMTLEIPQGAPGGSMHIQLTIDQKLNYEIYARFGGLPSNEIWDYFYVSETNNSGGMNFFSVSNSSKEMVDFSILFVREGTWNFAIKHLNSYSQVTKDETAMSISLERCPNKCSLHGSCSNYADESGLTVYSYCSCDRRHGGFDCSVEIVSHRGASCNQSLGHLWQSISLIASNAAAILPAYCSLQQKAFAEWVIYTCSGISSGLYHACGVGTWCALNFHVLQFMDFWLSSMAVVSTFVYLAAINEASRWAIHAALSILMALMAISNATRSANIVLVIVIGATSLFVGWLIESSTKYRSLFQSFSVGSCFDIPNRRQTIVDSLCNSLKKFLKLFRWGFMLAGILTLTLAAVSWKLESNKTYWVWHSVWHVSIYTSSFLFLCSKATNVSSQAQRGQSENYELARQTSMPLAGE